MTPSSKGYTLIEVLIAASIVALLTAVGLVSYASINRRSRDAKRQGDLEQLRSALEMYRADNGHYPPTNPSSFATADNLETDLVTGGYLSEIPEDPQTPDSIYRFRVNNLDAGSGDYFGYCLCADLETLTAESSTCTTETLPSSCDYGLRNP